MKITWEVGDTVRIKKEYQGGIYGPGKYRVEAAETMAGYVKIIPLLDHLLMYSDELEPC